MGHLFVAQGDLTKLACDAVLIPCDSAMNVTATWKSILPDGLPVGDHPRWLRLPGAPDRTGVVVLDDHDGRRIRAFVAVEGLATPDDVVGRLWDAISAISEGLNPRDGRARPLIGVPLPGVGEGGLGGRRGEVIDKLLQQHREAEILHDVALIVTSRGNLAAAQNRRHDSDWPELSASLRMEADRLGDLARHKQLSLFLGAGVSKPAGLPDWNELLSSLANKVGHSMPPAELAPEDAAIQLRDALGDRYHEVLTELLDAPRHAVGHALLANLRALQMVTTNYDRCLELAMHPVYEGEYRVLARQLAKGSLPWLLKLHGDVRVPESIVLTRDEFDRHKSESQALRGIVQALLLTSHLLFVGYSMREESFLELAEAVTRIRDQAQCPDRNPAGTAISLTRGVATAVEHPDIRYLSMDTTSVKEGARQLEIFLDRVCWKAASSEDWAAQYLLDSDYESGLRPNERALRDALVEFLSKVGDDAKTSPGWSIVADTLEALGANLERYRSSS